MVDVHATNALSWAAEGVRVTTFHSRSVLGDAPSFEDLIGKSAEHVEMKPALEEKTETVELGTGLFQRRIQAARMDWTWTAIDSDTDVHPALGDSDQALGKLIAIAAPWIYQRDDVVRIAVAGTFVIPVSDKVEGYKLLSKYLSFVKLDPDLISAFEVNFNRQVKGAISEKHPVDFNRVTKWSSRTKRKAYFSAPSSEQQHLAGALSQPVFDITCELDFNTVPDSASAPFAQDQLPVIVETLRESALKTLQEGVNG